MTAREAVPGERFPAARRHESLRLRGVFCFWSPAFRA
jgi:hypothetical protein